MIRTHPKGFLGGSDSMKWAGYGLTLVWFFFFLLFTVDTRLIYSAVGPAFYFGKDFALDTILRPGGLSSYIGNLFGQILEFRAAGAFAVTLLAGTLTVLSERVFNLFSGRRLTFLKYIPFVILAFAAESFMFALEAPFAVAFTLLGALAYMSFKKKALAARAALLLVITAILYFITAGVPMIFQMGSMEYVYARVHVSVLVLGWFVFCLLYEMRRRDSRGRTALALAVFIPALIAGPLACEFYFHVDPFRALRSFFRVNMFFGWPVITSFAMYSSFLLMVVTAMLSGARRLFSGEKTQESASRSAPQKLGSGREWALQLIITVVFLVVLSAATYIARWTSLPSKITRESLSVYRMANRGQYEEMLEAALNLSPSDIDSTVSHNINLALHKTGRLLYELLSWPQMNPTMLPAEDMQAFTRWHEHELMVVSKFLHLGRLNDAEHYAYELLYDNVRPELLQKLAIIHMVKEEPDIARIYLRRLTRNPVHRKEAFRYLSLMDEEPLLSGVEEISFLRENMLRRNDAKELIGEDNGSFYIDLDKLLLNLIDQNPSNRMAVDYLMASYLLRGDFVAVANNIHMLKTAGYEELPRLVQEAFLVYAYLREADPEDYGLSISPRIERDFERFHQLLAMIESFDSDDPIFAQFVNLFMGSFWFHLLYLQQQ